MPHDHVDGTALLSNLLEHSHADPFREMLRVMLQHLMDAEVSQRCNADYNQRAAERENSRNGYRERPLETRLGVIDLAIPKLRRGTYFPSFITPRRRWEKAFVNVVTEAYVQGVSTRKVEKLVEAMGVSGISKSEVSRMASSLDEMVTQFRTRPLTAAFPYLWLDALYIKVRQGAAVVSKAVLVAYAVAETGERQVLGLDVADGEMEACWSRFLQALLDRGLTGVKLVISDAHTGLKKAITRTLPGTSWQRCMVHFMRNVLSHVQKNAKDYVSAALKTVFNQQTRKDAGDAMGRLIALLEDKYPTVAELVMAAEDDVLAYMAFPTTHWRQIRSTNPLERLNREIRRRTDVVGIFPNDAALLRLVGALLIEQNDEWAVGRRYFSLSSMAQVLTPSTPALEVA